MAIISKAVVPDVSLTDPEMTTTLTPELTASTGLDALTHATEALVSNASSPLTDVHALESARLVFANLEHAVSTPQDLDRRTQMSLASPSRTTSTICSTPSSATRSSSTFGPATPTRRASSRARSCEPATWLRT